MAERLLKMKQLLERVPVSKAQVYRWIRAGTFPQSVSLGPQSIAFREAEVDAWIKARPSRAGQKQ